MAIYRTTVHGIPVDMGKIIKENEKQIALGNMGTNARGDVLGSGGKIIQTREEVMKKYYEANPELNPKAVVNLKASPKDKKEQSLTELNKENAIPQAPASTPRRKKEPKVVEAFDIEQTEE